MTSRSGVHRDYPSKLLLFGEHTVLLGSSSLAIPLHTMSMSWRLKKGDQHPTWLIDYMNDLRARCRHILDIERLDEWLSTQTISTTIPVGYGLGSSGALTAALYDVGAIKPQKALETLIRDLGQMEAYYHGESSGMDPLISYTEQGIFNHHGSLVPLRLEDVKISPSLQLLDSKRSRKGRDMIAMFLDYQKTNPKPISHLKDLNDRAIDQLLVDDEGFLDTIAELSKLQLGSLSFLIPTDIQRVWSAGMATGKYYMKICGAGGGGFFQVWSLDKPHEIDAYPLINIQYTI